MNDWWDRNKEEIKTMAAFLGSMSDDPVQRREQMRLAVAYYYRASALSSEANGLYRVALRENYPSDGQAELRKRTAEAESHHEEVMRDKLRGMVKAFDHFIDSARTLSSDDRAQMRSGNLTP
jgi:hypothetical protein